MIEEVSKKQKDAEFTEKHTLTDQDFRKLITEKLERAHMYNEALKKREAAIQEDY